MLGYLRSGSKRTKMIWWVLTIATVFGFILGFSFFGSMGRDSSLQARRTGDYGSVDGVKVTRDMWTNAYEAARESYRQRYGSDPVDRDLRTVEQQAWHTLVNEQLFRREAARMGLSATDNEVVVGMRTNPPQALLALPDFQTDGKFDPAKYQAMMRNPNVDWSRWEDQLRGEIPIRKLQEGLMSSLKLSQGELRQAWSDRYEKLSAVVLQVPAADTGSSPGTEADLQRVYDKYRDRMSSPARTQLEVLSIPMQFAPEEVKTATEQAKALSDRARGGEDFAQLARDNSEGPNAARGGVIDRWINPMELGPIGQTLSLHKPGDVLDPYREGSQVMVFKILDPKADTSAAKQPPPTPNSLRLAEIVVKVRPSPEARQKQYADAVEIAKRARAAGLGRAATEKGLATQKTSWFDFSNVPPQLYGCPELAEWGLSAKQGEVSQVYLGSDEMTIGQVAAQHAAGPPTRAEVADQLKQVADAEHRVRMAKPRADQVAAAIASGQPLEAAAKAAGLTTTPVTMTREQPDPRLNVSPEFRGRLWAGKPGQVIGPVETPAGWYFGRVESLVAAPDSLWNDRVKGQITTEILSRRQRTFFDNYVAQLRAKAHIRDNHSAYTTAD